VYADEPGGAGDENELLGNRQSLLYEMKERPVSVSYTYVYTYIHICIHNTHIHTYFHTHTHIYPAVGRVRR